ncbi:MAG: hypothetical protein ACLTMD_05015 [Clostridium sp.]
MERQSREYPRLLKVTYQREIFRSGSSWQTEICRRWSGKEVPGNPQGKEAAVKNLVEILIDENKSIPLTLSVSSKRKVLLKRAPEGTGIIAGGPARP